MIKLFFFSFLAVFLSLSSCVTKQSESKIFSTIHGDLELSDPLALELVAHPAFQRMRHIEQHGLNTKTLKEKSFTRFDHSLGVYKLLKKYGASREEQIAGLLHDVSHTAFSHVGDTFFGHEDGEASWQDLDHENFLEQSGLNSVLKKHDFSLEAAQPKNKNYRHLERDLPDLCADRINYILHGASILGLLSDQEVKEVNKSLAFDHGKSLWYFRDKESAFKFSHTSLIMTKNSWGHPASFAATTWFLKALKRGIANNLLQEEDFRSGTDDVVWAKLEKSKDPEIQSCLSKIKSPLSHFYYRAAKLPCQKGEELQKIKLRFVDPYIRDSESSAMKRLSSLHEGFSEDFSSFTEDIGSGHCVTFL